MRRCSERLWITCRLRPLPAPVGALAAFASLAALSSALAQDTLPTIIVETPSPVRKTTPEVEKPAPSQPAQRRPAQRAEPVQARRQTPLPPAPAPSPAPALAESPPPPLVLDEATFFPVTVATEAHLLSDGGETIADALKDRPGISATDFAPGASRPIIRGLDSFRIRVQENGIGSHDVAAISEDHAVPIDPFAADQIEIVRGPATLRYGSQAIGGVVAVQNQRIPTEIPDGGFRFDSLGGLSSVDDGGDSALKMTAGRGPTVLHLDGFARSAEDYDTPRGIEPNSFVDSEGFSAGGSFVGRKGYIGLAYADIASLYGIPGEEALEAAPRIDLHQGKILSRGEWRPERMGIAAVRYWFGASDYEHSELVRGGHGHGHGHGREGDEHEHEAHEHEQEHEAHEHGDEAHEQEGASRFEIGNRFTNDEVEGRIEIQHLPFATAFGALDGAAGIQIIDRRTQGESFEGDSLLEPADTESIAGFIFEELQASERLRLQAAGRIESIGVDGLQRLSPLDPNDPVVALTRDFDPVSASLGALYDLNRGVIARLTGQYVERAPAPAELFSKGIHEATGTFELGNPDLDIEQARTIEAGLARAAGRLRFETSAYYTEFDGFIFRRLTGIGCGATLESCGEEDELDQVLFTQKDATFHGAEVAVQYDAFVLASKVIGFDGRYDFVRARFEDGTNVPRIPAHRLGGGVYWRSEGWFARAGILHPFEQDEIAREEIVTPGYTLVSAELSHTRRLAPVGSVMPELTIGLKGENLADDEVFNHASFKRREGVLLQGANVRLFGRVLF